MEKPKTRDEYFMGVAEAVQLGANCHGTVVGAIVVMQERIISTGYNGTPAGFKNCRDGGCVRCSDSKKAKEKREHEMVDPSHRSGAALDRCICVHAEQNAFLTAARFGIGLDGAVLYTTDQPCFTCLKEACQVGISRIIYKEPYKMDLLGEMQQQYNALVKHLGGGRRDAFSQLSDLLATAPE